MKLKVVTIITELNFFYHILIQFYNLYKKPFEKENKHVFLLQYLYSSLKKIGQNNIF